MLASLASVDWVLPFGDDPSEQDTPLQLILKVQPDVLVKGGDYTIDTIVGAREVLQRHASQVEAVAFDDDAIFADVDTPAALEQLNRL